MAGATAAMSNAVGDPEDAKWRVKLRHRMDKVRKRALVDYADRRDNHGCDDSEVVTYDDEDDVDEADDFERGLPIACKEAAKPFRVMSLQAKSWMDHWNSCGTGNKRNNLTIRLWKTLRLIRKDAYIAVGCDI